MSIKAMKEHHVHGLFATMNNIEEALEYGYMIINTLSEEDRIGVITALHVVLNTALTEAERVSLKEM